MDENQPGLDEHEIEEVPESIEPEVKEEPEDNTTVEGAEKRWPGWPGESVFRMLVPVQKVGSIIGRKGEFIKKMCEETRARIKILDGPPGTSERAVLSDLRHKSIFNIFTNIKNERAGCGVALEQMKVDAK